MEIGIIKYGLGNIGSVYQALKNINASPVIVNDPLEIKNIDKLILPGVGNFTRSKRILDKKEFLNTTFLTTDPSALSINIPNSYFMPNPADKSFETLNNFNKNCPYDVFFAMSHGVHRGQLKSGKGDDRENFINKLINLNKEIKFDVYGMNNVQPIWADQFIKKIANSYMGLNLSRGKPIKYYSSDRIVQLLSLIHI